MNARAKKKAIKSHGFGPRVALGSANESRAVRLCFARLISAAHSKGVRYDTNPAAFRFPGSASIGTRPAPRRWLFGLWRPLHRIGPPRHTPPPVYPGIPPIDYPTVRRRARPTPPPEHRHHLATADASRDT